MSPDRTCRSHLSPALPAPIFDVSSNTGEPTSRLHRQEYCVDDSPAGSLLLTSHIVVIVSSPGVHGVVGTCQARTAHTRPTGEGGSSTQRPAPLGLLPRRGA